MHSYGIGVFCKNQDLEDSLIFRIVTMLMHRSVNAIPKASMTDIRGDSRACRNDTACSRAITMVMRYWQFSKGCPKV